MANTYIRSLTALALTLVFPHFTPRSGAAAADDVGDGARQSAAAVFPFDRPGFHSAYDSSTGNLLVAEYANNQATLYSLKDKLVPLKQLPTPARPSAVVAKQVAGKSYFVVGGPLDKRIDIFAADSGERVSSVHLHTPSILHLAASQSADDPYVYYLSRYGDKQEPYLGRLNVRTGDDEGAIHPAGYFAVSSDGAGVYMLTHDCDYRLYLFRVIPRDAENPSPKDLPPSKLALEPIEYHPMDVQQMAVGPGNTFFGLNTNIMPTTLGNGRGSLDFHILAFAASKPWAVGIKDSTFHVASVNDKRTIASVALPGQFNYQQHRSQRFDDKFQSQFVRQDQITPVFVDEQRRRFIVATVDQCAVIPWDGLALPDEPQVAVNSPTETTAIIGQLMDIPLKAFDPRVAVALGSAPQGMDLKDGRLSWKPSGADIGFHDVLIESSFGEARTEQTLRVHVKRPYIALPFACQHVSLSPDGKLAVTWSQPKGDRRADLNAPGKLALVDVAASKVLAEKEIEKGIRLARVNQQGVFVLVAPSATAGPNDGTELVRLNIPDLSLAETAVASGPATSLTLTGEKYAWTSGEPFALPGLKKLPSFVRPASDPGDRPRRLSEGSPPMLSRVDDGWYADGVGWDQSVSRASILIDPAAILRTGELPDPSLAVTSWGRMVQQSDLLAPPDRVLLRTAGDLAQRPVVLSEVPAAVVSSRVDAPGSALMFALRVHELVDANETQAIPLVMKPLPDYVSQFKPYEGPFFLEIDAAGGVIVACAGRELLVVPEQEVNKGALREPLHFRWRQDPLVLAGRGAAKASYEVVAGAPPFQFKLTIEGVETRTESKTRKAALPVDVSAVADAVLGRIRNLNWPAYAGARGNAESNTDIRLLIADYTSAVTPYYRLLTGRSPSGVPVLASALVEVVDDKRQIAQMRHYYLLDLPETHVLVAFDPSGDLARTPPASRRRSNVAESVRQTKDEAAAGQRVAEVDRQRVIEYSNQLRKENPSQQIPPEELKQRAAAARNAASGYLARTVNEVRTAKMQTLRTWRDKKGHQTQAQLKSFFADQVVLNLASGKEVTVPLEKLSDDDQKFLADTQQPDPSELELAIAQLRLLGQGMLKHENAREAFPPAFIVDSRGKPLLSWRVAILPYVGGEELFRLFHFDEPWDSEHNRVLLEFMPSVFAAAAGVDASGKTPWLAIRHPRSVLAGRPIRGREILDGYLNVAAFGEAVAARAVPWTRPNDIPAANLVVLKSWLHARANWRLFGFIGGKVQAMSAESLSTTELLSAIDYRDQAPLSEKFHDPLALPDSSARKALPQNAAAEPADKKRPRPAEGAVSAPRKSVKVQLAENSPVGTVVGKVTGAPTGSTYRIVNHEGRDHDDHTFEVHPTTGVITVKNTGLLDADSFPTLVLQIVAEDSRGQRAPITIMEVVLGDKNEPPTLLGAAPVQLHDFVREGDNVGLIVARDPEGDELTYEIESKDLGGILRIEKHMGFLSAGSPQAINKLREGRTYKVKVTVTDKHGLTDSTGIDVNYAKVR